MSHLRALAFKIERIYFSSKMKKVPRKKISLEKNRMNKKGVVKQEFNQVYSIIDIHRDIAAERFIKWFSFMMLILHLNLTCLLIN